MVEIEFSYIEDEPERIEVINQLLQDFHEQTNITVHLRLMAWEQAWQDLFSFTLKGKGPEVSHVGSTWTSSLVEMNALRPFSPLEVGKMGGIESFIPGDWQSVILQGDPRTWAIPWYSYIYLIGYRQDWFQSAGIDEQAAFSSIETIIQTVQQLKTAGVTIPMVIPVFEDTDLIHMVASWIWGAGGDFISEDGKKILFNQPEAFQGLKAYFGLYSCLSPQVRGLNHNECLDLFAEGKAAIFFTNSDSIQFLGRENSLPVVRDHLGTVVPTGIPWFGGGNLIVWRHAREDPERERAALALVNFLTSPPVQIKRSMMDSTLPSRMDALPGLKLVPASLGNTFSKAVKTGRPYLTVPLWRRIEFQLGQELTHIQGELMASPDVNLEEVLHNHIDPLARRINLMIG